MKTAKWFSRHTPTPEQLDDIAQMGYTLSQDDIDAGIELGSRDITPENLEQVICELRRLTQGVPLCAVFGVFATPIQSVLTEIAEIQAKGRVSGTPCYASWNVKRSAEGGKPTFHHEFILVGYIG